MNAISIVVPTLNESENIAVLLQRIAKTFAKSGIVYEVIFIDDNSKDGTQASIQKLANKYPVRLYQKLGHRGKAYSLLEGFDQARYDIICMIDADLQYPPEAILPMYKLMAANKVDVVLTEREYAGVSKFRQLSTNVFNLIFTRLLFGFNYDSQSGLKLFRKTVIKDASLAPTPWSFDMEFIVRALENNFKILSYPIPFSERHSGEAKVRFLKVTYELSSASLKLKFRSSPSKIKRAYRMNIKLAEKAIGMAVIAIISILGAVSFATVLSNQNTSAVGVIRSTVEPLTTLLSDTTVTNPNPVATPTTPVQPSATPVNTTQTFLQPANNTTAMTPNATSTNAMMNVTNKTDSNQLTLAAPTASTPPANTTQVAEATYPLRDTSQAYNYETSATNLPSWTIQLPLVSLIAIALFIGAYAAITARRTTRTATKNPGVTS